VLAPVGVRVAHAPEQNTVGFDVTLTVGSGFTMSVRVLVPEQPDVLPATVYVVVIVGDTSAGFPTILPGFHV
jgi:hypothetical protein